jgi:hypothetical protein
MSPTCINPVENLISLCMRTTPQTDDEDPASPLRDTVVRSFEDARNHPIVQPRRAGLTQGRQYLTKVCHGRLRDEARHVLEDKGIRLCARHKLMHLR